MCKIDLNCDWKVRSEELAWGPEMSYAVLARKDGWINAELPCDVHMPLIENGIIKEPLEADYSFACEWIEEKSWWFRKTFQADQKLLDGDVVELTLESLDAGADIFLDCRYPKYVIIKFIWESHKRRKNKKCVEYVISY